MTKMPRQAVQQQMPNGVVAVPVGPPSPPISTRVVTSPFRFPLAVTMSMALSALCYTFASEVGITAGDLSSVSRSANTWMEIGPILGWKTLELAVCWWGELDGADLVALTLLSHLPPLYLLTTFYGIRPTTLIVSLAIDVFSTALPFRLLRNLSPSHDSNTPRGTVANRYIISDYYTLGFASAFAGCIYGLVVFLSFGTWLPTYLVVHFDGIRDISAAYATSLPLLMGSFLPLGSAATTFLFTPATAAKPDLEDSLNKSFDPETATLWETVRWNAWGYSKRTRVMIVRTVTLAGVTFFNTWVQVAGTVQGAESMGAAGWAAMWAGAATATGVALWWVGDVRGVE